jgi:hypothetical protein
LNVTEERQAMLNWLYRSYLCMFRTRPGGDLWPMRRRAATIHHDVQGNPAVRGGRHRNSRRRWHPP